MGDLDSGTYAAPRQLTIGRRIIQRLQSVPDSRGNRLAGERRLSGSDSVAFLKSLGRHIWGIRRHGDDVHMPDIDNIDNGFGD